MAAATVLSSSPPHLFPFGGSLHRLPSPHTSSPSIVFNNSISSSKLKTGSRVASIPSGAVAGFCNIRTLFDEVDLTGPPKGLLEKPGKAEEEYQRLERAADRPVKPTKLVELDKPEAAAKKSKRKPAKRPREPKLKLDKKPAAQKSRKAATTPKSNEVAEASAYLPIPPVIPARSRKPRRRKTLAEAENQAQLENLPVTKPKLQSDEKTVVEGETKEEKAQSLALDQAVARRRQWTPVKDTHAASEKSVFLDLSSKFGYNNQSAQETAYDVVPPKDNALLVKENQIEVVNLKKRKSSKKSKESPVKKTKTPAKKATTITALAIAQYKVGSQHTLAAAGIDTRPLPAETVPKSGRRLQRVEPKRRGLSSPQTALRKLQNQDFVFGTSSQLVESPQDICDLQAALKASEAYITCSAPRASDNSTSEQKLWTVAARDETNMLLPPDTVPERPQLVPSASPSSDSFVNIDEIESASQSDLSPEGWAQLAPATVTATSAQAAPALTAPSRKRKAPTPSSQLSKAPSTPMKPNARRKKRASDCFIDIDEIEDSEPESTPLPPQRSSPVPAVGLELSPSTATATIRATTDGIEIEPATEKLSKRTSISRELAAAISTAVKSAPRTRDPARPSWWEKILLYDPIAIEDLTAWLNEADGDGRSLRLVEQGPVKQVQVQRWCEDSSVCCFYREATNFGRKRKAAGNAALH